MRLIEPVFDLANNKYSVILRVEICVGVGINLEEDMG